MVYTIDNLSNGHEEAIRRAQSLSNCSVGFEVGDIRDGNF